MDSDDVPLIQRRRYLLGKGAVEAKKSSVDVVAKEEDLGFPEDVYVHSQLSQGKKDSNGIPERKIAEVPSTASPGNCSLASPSFTNSTISQDNDSSSNFDLMKAKTNCCSCSCLSSSPEVEGCTVGLKKVNFHVEHSLQPITGSSHLVKVKSELIDGHSFTNPCGDVIDGFPDGNMRFSIFTNESDMDDLDHISLRERREMLLACFQSGFGCFGDPLGIQRKRLHAPKLKLHNSVCTEANGTMSERESKSTMTWYTGKIQEDGSLLLQDISAGSKSMQDDGKVKDEINHIDHRLSLEKILSNSSPEKKLAASTFSGSLCNVVNCSTKTSNLPDTVLHSASCFQESQEGELKHSDQISIPAVDMPKEQTEVLLNPSNQASNLSSSTCPIKVEIDPLEIGWSKNALEDSRVGHGFLKKCVQKLCKDDVGSCLGYDAQVVKSEREILDEVYDDALDCMSLKERMQMPISTEVSTLDNSGTSKKFLKSVPRVIEHDSAISLKTKTECFTLQKRRKRTATDSAETALEEDAPGLIKVLLDRGISIDEIKLYGGMEIDEALDNSSSEDIFSELEDVITQLFSRSASLLKFERVRHTKGSHSYCLNCLISLIEQARYLEFRQWPVEWGWCRDLQSFIFIFAKHNRIVLERPEYGYATYFFEIVEALPIDWQIKRLVTAMKLTSCSRLTLIENKSLLVGKDLTEGEARVLEEYGWKPYSGLGTMLNYCDRVVHDRKNDWDMMDWRSKIGKLLMDGYDKGKIVLNHLPEKVLDYMGGGGSQIKLETT